MLTAFFRQDRIDGLFRLVGRRCGIGKIAPSVSACGPNETLFPKADRDAPEPGGVPRDILFFPDIVDEDSFLPRSKTIRCAPPLPCVCVAGVRGRYEGLGQGPGASGESRVVGRFSSVCCLIDVSRPPPPLRCCQFLLPICLLGDVPMVAPAHLTRPTSSGGPWRMTTTVSESSAPPPNLPTRRTAFLPCWAEPDPRVRKTSDFVGRANVDPLGGLVS